MLLQSSPLINIMFLFVKHVTSPARDAFSREMNRYVLSCCRCPMNHTFPFFHSASSVGPTTKWWEASVWANNSCGTTPGRATSPISAWRSPVGSLLVVAFWLVVSLPYSPHCTLPVTRCNSRPVRPLFQTLELLLIPIRALMYNNIYKYSRDNYYNEKMS